MNVVTGDNDDTDADDNNKARDMSGDNKDNNSKGDDLVFDNDNISSTTNPTNGDPPWISLLAMVNDYVDNDPGDYDEFCANYDLNNDNAFDNDNAGNKESYIYMMVTDSWNPPKDEYDDDDILVRPVMFDVGCKPSIHPNFFNGILNGNLGCSYINDDPISNTQVFHHTLLKSLMRKKG